MQLDFIWWSMLMLIILNLLLILREKAEFDIERGMPDISSALWLSYFRISIKQEGKGNAVGPDTCDYFKWQSSTVTPHLQTSEYERNNYLYDSNADLYF
jgi:hypothetical protein